MYFKHSNVFKIHKILNYSITTNPGFGGGVFRLFVFPVTAESLFTMASQIEKQRPSFSKTGKAAEEVTPVLQSGN